ncbi:MAG: molybdenum cofactor biosynthesis protein MoaE [Bacillota bacterium]|nr:molybdenum cofactor biosynthesis protein MoaE [Bacillota bacterium]
MKVVIDEWLKEAKESSNANKVGMWLMHNGVVRSTAKAEVREGIASGEVKAMDFSYDALKLEEILERGKALAGIYYLRAELASGKLKAGDSIMYVLIGADTRPHAVDALNSIVGEIKATCVKEVEIF